MATPCRPPPPRDRDLHDQRSRDLLVVVAIIGILAAVATQSYSGYVSSSKSAETGIRHHGIVGSKNLFEIASRYINE